MAQVSRFAVFLVIVVLLCPVQTGWAADCTNGPCCRQSDIKGPIIQPRHNKEKDDGEDDGGGDLNLDGFTILSGILAIGQTLRSGSNKGTASIDKNFEAQSAMIRQLFASLGAARQKSAMRETFGPNSRTYMTSKGFGSLVQAGLSARDDLASRFRSDQHDYLRRFDTKKEIQDRLARAPETGALFRTEGTMSSEQLYRSKEWAKTVLDATPARNLPQNSKQLSEDYGAIRKVKETKLLIPEAILSDLIADRAPTVEMEGWPARMHERMGGKGSPGRTVEGKLSPYNLMATLADARFANQDWHTGKDGIHGKTRTGVLRELLQTRVDRLMMELRQMQWMDRMAAVMAERVLSGNARYNDMLRKLKSQ